jgi:hypothetical protein
MTNAIKLHTIEKIQKHKKYELRNIYKEFTQYRLYEIITYYSKQTQIFSRTLELGVRRFMVLPTHVSNCHLI